MCIGGLQKGFQDGSFTTARFSNPQGMILDQHILYVADSDNHAIRKVSLTIFFCSNSYVDYIRKKFWMLLHLTKIMELAHLEDVC